MNEHVSTSMNLIKLLLDEKASRENIASMGHLYKFPKNAYIYSKSKLAGKQKII